VNNNTRETARLFHRIKRVASGSFGPGRAGGSRRCLRGFALATTLLTGVLCGSSALPAATTTDADDSTVLSACLAAIYRDAHAQTPTPELQVVHVWPEGMRSNAEVGKSQLHTELRGLDWSLASAAIDHLYGRTSAHWNPPSTISLADMPVRVRKPPRKRQWYKTPFTVTFWPPGYTDDRDFAVVLASFTPSDHGARAACQLRKLDEAWSVEKKWVVSYL
jgi:hypothetical protein